MVSYTYQDRKRASLNLTAPNASAWSQKYIYDPFSRLTNVTSPAGAFGYDYSTDDTTPAMRSSRSLVRVLNLPNGARITNAFDSVARLTATVLLKSDDSILNSHFYTYNVGNQRTKQTFTAGNATDYTYDPIGQLKTARGKTPGATNRWNEQFGYAYDAAGNLNFRTNYTMVQTFNVNNLNELTTVTNNGRLTVAGTTAGLATSVTVNTSNAFLYADATFASTNQPWVNGNNTYQAIAADSYGRHDTNSITVNLPGTNTFVYDLNGNMRTNGTRIFDYDDENELIRITEPTAWKSEFAYDGKMRRRIEKNFRWDAGTSGWAQTNEVRFIYDGNVVLQERDTNNIPQITLTRGNDLSGRLQGAGGIGGLLALTSNSKLLADVNAHNYYHSDGSGNMTVLINNSQMLVAKYLYDPFGNMLSASGPMAFVNNYRFSSKRIHESSETYDYLYRWYTPNLQGWINRDPLGDRGFGLVRHRLALFLAGEPNRYMFVRNRPTIRVDSFGLEGIKVPEIPDLNPKCAQDPDVAGSYAKLLRCESDSGDGAAEANTICDCLAQGSDVAQAHCLAKFEKGFQARCNNPSCPPSSPPNQGPPVIPPIIIFP